MIRGTNGKMLAAVGALTLGLTACQVSTPTVNTSPANRASQTTHGAPAAAKTTAAAPKVAHVGDPIILKGLNGGDQVTVTLVAVDAKAQATDSFSSPDAGNAYYSAEWRIQNTGTGAFSDAPDGDSQVMDAQGQRFQPTIVESISSGPMFPTLTTVAPGGTALGWTVYQVPTGTVVTGAQFSLDAGMGNSGQWVVP